MPDPVAVGDHQQILRHVPDTVAFPGLFLDALRQRRVQLRQLVGQLAIALFALPKRLLGHHLFGDVGMRADQADGLSLRVAFDGGFDRYPAGLAVAGADDAVLHGVFARVAGDRVAEFPFGRFTVPGMDALDPILMGLVGRVRRQPVDQQIFRRPAIAESGSQVNLEAADLANLLHTRQFGLAFPQFGGGEIILGHIAAYHQHAADAVTFVDRAVAIGPVDLREPAVTGYRNELILKPGRAATAYHLFDLRPDDGPDFHPAFPPALTERARVPLGPHVIELNEIGAPPDKHRVVTVEQDAYRRAQALRPGLGLSERCGRPVILPRQCAHLAAAGEKIRRSRPVDFQHRGSIGGEFSPIIGRELSRLSHA